MLQSLLRVLVSAGLVGGLMIGALQIDSDWLDELNELGNLPQQVAYLYRQNRYGEKLQATSDETFKRIRAKDRIAREVLAGRLDLRAAVASFVEVSKDATYDWDHYQPSRPDWSAQRRCAQYVIDLVEGLLIQAHRDPTPVVSALTEEADACR
jgi:hypothetical protein